MHGLSFQAQKDRASIKLKYTVYFGPFLSVLQGIGVD